MIMNELESEIAGLFFYLHTLMYFFCVCSVAECGAYEPICFLHTSLLLAFGKHESTSKVSARGNSGTTLLIFLFHIHQMVFACDFICNVNMW